MPGFPLRPVIAFALVVLAGPAFAATPLYQWVQYGSLGLEGRAIMDGGQTCPVVKIDGKDVAMGARAAPTPAFPITVCAVAIPAGAKGASVGPTPLPLPKARPSHILLIGDTGCRLTREGIQACNDANAWPFARGSVVEAKLRPDLVIHVGDFYYREAGCPLGDNRCAGSPFGDTWAAWRADFFEPAKPLLDVAPFVLTRGNHEECARGGGGWSRMLDPYPGVSPDGCLGPGAPFVVDLGEPKLVVMDVSTAAELRASPTQVPFYRKQFQDVARLAPAGPVWLVFHRPIWASGVSVFGFVVGDNKTLAEAARNDIPGNVDLLLSGHIHTFQILAYREDLPIQIVSGHGGDALHKTAPADPVGLVIDGVTVAEGRGAPGVFGFVMLDREASGWKATNYTIEGDPLTVCHLKGRKMDCSGP